MKSKAQKELIRKTIIISIVAVMLMTTFAGLF